MMNQVAQVLAPDDLLTELDALNRADLSAWKFKAAGVMRDYGGLDSEIEDAIYLRLREKWPEEEDRTYAYFRKAEEKYRPMWIEWQTAGEAREAEKEIERLTLQKAEADKCVEVLDAIIAKQKAEPEREPTSAKALVVAEPKSIVAPIGFAPLNIAELTLDPSTPFDNAQQLVTVRAWYPEEEMRTWNYWQGTFWQWDGQCWKEVEDETVRSFLWAQLNAAEKIGKKGKRERFEPQMAHINATLDALKAATNVPTKGNPMPKWFGEQYSDDFVRECVALQNGILHIPRRQLVSHTPRFWSPNVLDFAYDPEAKCPRWVQFLEEIWPKDSEAQQCLMEVLGLCFTDVTKYQKAFMFVGPRRGGRGTIGRVLKGLIGAENYLGTSFKAFGENFGLESFIAKKVAVFSDARIDGLLQRSLSTIVERLLLITGQDDMHVNRKNAKYWEGMLTTRAIVFSNELLKLPDESGALSGRFITFQMKQSFWERR